MSSPDTLVIITTGDPVPNVAETRGPFANMIRETIGELWHGTFRSVDVRTEAPPDPCAAAAFVITGSSANVPNRDDWILRAEHWLREVFRAGTPTLGICFGHQILAQALGGDVRQNPRGREIGTISVERLVEDPIFEGLPASFEANATHVDSVSIVPEGAVRLARSSLEDHQALRFSSTCYGVQFHPEIDAHVMRGYLEARRDVLRPEGFDVDSLLARVTEAHAARGTLRNFVRHIIPRSRARAPSRRVATSST
jgi:GMP synthase (glutamine-hydrolysing)